MEITLYTFSINPWSWVPVTVISPTNTSVSEGAGVLGRGIVAGVSGCIGTSELGGKVSGVA
ncbi:MULTISPECIES: hypothetical protein [Planktothrix]|uniref:hypothetical protein n=1 Tax=Planktothrix TaxID=54304 RepID=UPI0006935A96|nr:hypothetical protein [Planktothrix agardhii]